MPLLYCIAIDPFTITVFLHSSGTFVNGKMTILQKNRDVINVFNFSTRKVIITTHKCHKWMQDCSIVKGSIYILSCIA